MNKEKSFFKYQMFSIILAIGLGVLLHFTFDWSNNNPFIGIFSAVNESIWEHLKILFFPMLLTTIIGYFYYKKAYRSYLCSKTKSIFLSMAFIIIFHYTYSGIIGEHIAIIDIISFIVAIIIGEIYTYKKTIRENKCNNKLSFLVLLITSLAFIIFTFKPPHIGIFKDPNSGSYGIQKLEK